MLAVKDLLGEYRPATSQEILAEAHKVIQQHYRRGARITTPAASSELFCQKLALREQEVFAVLFLDTRHRVIAYEELFFGTIDGTSVHPRIVVQRALAHNAAAVIVAHNHPSGDAEPSSADQALTERLKAALALVDVRLLDHLVVGKQCLSLAERGLV